MSVLTEGDLQIKLPDGAYGRKFDDEATHGLTHCMKAVDFVVELEDRIFFIEFKDPDHPKAAANRKRYIAKLLDGSLDDTLKEKYRDSFLYEWGCGRVTKPVYYLVLIAASSLSAAELLARTDALKRKIPLLGPGNKPWENPIAHGCSVMNIKAWNDVLPNFPVSRISA